MTPQDELALAVRARAENLFQSRRMLCSEAVLLAMNEGFCGGLGEDQAMSLGSALAMGVGGSGCMCGALSGSLVASGYFLHRGGVSRKSIRAAGARLHDEFRHAHGSTCCRVLMKRSKGEGAAHFDQCRKLTGFAAEAVARSVLALRPELAAAPRPAALDKRHGRLGGLVRRLSRAVFSGSRA